MSFKILLNIVLSLNAISCINVKASDVFSEPFTFRDVYQKPAFMAALDWLQTLEDERDKADMVGNFDVFKKTTDEISATIAGKYGLAQRSATPEEEIIIVHSITRTRHRFMGQRHMLHDRYLGYDRSRTSALLQTDSRFKDHMAAVLVIDTMVMKAMNDDEFHEQWDQWTEMKVAPAEFIPTVITYVQTYEKKEVLEALKQPFQDFLQHRQEAIGLANDMFNVFAPKMTLTKFYHEVIPSGETYKGWTVHKASDLAYPATLTEEEKRRFPDLEGEIRTSLTQPLMKSTYASDVFSSSERAVCPSDKIRDQLGLGEDEMVVEYIYDPTLRERGYRVDGTGPKSFYLSRSVKPELAEMLAQWHGLLSSERIRKFYRYIIMVRNGTAPDSIIEEVLKMGEAGTLNDYATNLYNGENGVTRDIPKAVEIMRESADLGNNDAKDNLPLTLSEYSVKLFHGRDGVMKDISKALEIMIEAAELGNDEAKINLGNCSVMLFDGSNGLTKDISKAIEVCREAFRLGDQRSKTNLPIMIVQHAVNLYNGENGLTEDIPESIEMMREATSLGSEKTKKNLQHMLAQYSVKLFYGQDKVVRNIPQSIEMMKEGAKLGDDNARKNLYVCAFKLFHGENGITRDIPHALEIMREVANFEDEEAKKNLPIFLYDYAVMLLYGQEGVQIDHHKATEIIGEAAGLGSEKATYMLFAMKIGQEIVAACRR